MPSLTAHKNTLREETSSATACMRALDVLLGPQWVAWEPETLWMDLSRQGVAVPLSNREQIMAGRSLVTTGRFWYDALAFEKTCVVFNNEEATHLGIEDAPVAYIAHAVKEAEAIHKYYENETLEFDREPLTYTAIQLQREGFIVAPEELEWAQTALDRLLNKTVELKTLKQQIREGWAAAPKGKTLLDAAFPETPAGVQLARLAAVKLHCSNRAQEQVKQLIALDA